MSRIVPNPTTESGATYGDPHLTLSGTPTTWQGWVNYYRPLWDTQSNAMLKDHGSSTAGNYPLSRRAPGHRGQRTSEGQWLGHRPLRVPGRRGHPGRQLLRHLRRRELGPAVGHRRRPPSTSRTSPAADPRPGRGPSATATAPRCRIPPIPTRPMAVHRGADGDQLRREQHLHEDELPDREAAQRGLHRVPRPRAM